MRKRNPNERNVKMTKDELLAMEAGYELDSLIATEVMGWSRQEETPDGYICEDGGADWISSDGKDWWCNACDQESGFPRFSTDLAIAWKLMEKLYDDGWIAGIGSLAQKPRGWRAELCNMWEADFERCPTDIEANADSAPLAICRAALLAIMEAK